jgi:NADH:ubiquinone oxidoreductase subunit B-like Fe-S oxidoreductase
MGIEEKLPSGILLTSVEKLSNWARKSSFWGATFGLACCAIEMILFIVTVFIAYTYVWRRGGLDWN